MLWDPCPGKSKLTQKVRPNMSHAMVGTYVSCGLWLLIYLLGVYTFSCVSPKNWSKMSLNRSIRWHQCVRRVQEDEGATKVLQGSVTVCTRSSVMQVVPGATKMEVARSLLCFIVSSFQTMLQFWEQFLPVPQKICNSKDSLS